MGSGRIGNLSQQGEREEEEERERMTEFKQVK